MLHLFFAKFSSSKEQKKENVISIKILYSSKVSFTHFVAKWEKTQDEVNRVKADSTKLLTFF